MRERGSPDIRSAVEASDLGNQGVFPRRSLISSQSADQPQVVPQVSELQKSALEIPSSEPQPTTTEKFGGLGLRQLASVNQMLAKALNPPPMVRRWARTWYFWVLLATIGTTGLGLTAVALLLKLPAMPNCPSMFWPTASASVRLYCAQLAANKQTVKDLLEAIALVQSLPKDHPLRPEINRQIEDWSLDILNLADRLFQTGKLKEAIATAKQIPSDVPAYPLVQKRIARWQSIWSKAEEIYRQAESQLGKLELNQAFRIAVRLLSVGNTYWSTTKYDELTQIIDVSRQDSEKLLKAKSLMNQGGINNLQEAIKLAQSIGAKSYIYETATKLIPEIGRKMIDLAESRLEQQDLDGALDIARKIPAEAKIQAEVEDFINIVQAQSIAKGGTASNIEAAIAQVQKISAERPLYKKTQLLVGRWQQEIDDIGKLEKARQLAQLGTVRDLMSAIALSQQLISDHHPRAQEAKAEITRWRSQIETIEDRPLLARAEQLARAGDEGSLQVAVEEVSKIARGRALSQEAQTKKRQWSSQIERLQDEPYLDQARQLARTGNLPEAIAVAQKILPGRSLSNQAQAEIRDWQGQMRSQRNWQEANRLASQATPDSLAAAIRSAQQIPASTSIGMEAQDSINQWSYQILSMAQDRANEDLPGAIAIAQRVPSGTPAYLDAREQIKRWENLLNPPQETLTPEAVTPSPEEQPPSPTSLPEPTTVPPAQY